MSNLIKAELYKQKVNGIFVMYVITMFIVGIGVSISGILGAEANNDWFWYYNSFISNSMILNMAIGTMSAFYYVRDFNDKSIHHALMSGYRRKDVVLSKLIVFNIQTIAAFLIYLISSMIIVFAMNGTKLSHNYNISIAKYIIITLILKILYLAAFNGICICFCYLVRNSAAYLLIIFSLWAYFLGPIYKLSFVMKNAVLKTILKLTIMVQDQIMFADRLGSGVFKITSSEAAYYLSVVILTILIFYKLTCFILKRVEIK